MRKINQKAQAPHVLVVLGHPRKDSLCAALAAAYTRGAREAGAIVEELFAGEMAFEPNVIHATPHLQALEPDIKRAQQLISWAQHVVFVYPTWWGTMPALLKGFLDRVFMSGFAFREIEGGTGYAPLLSGRTAQLITTMDTPPFVYRLFYRAPGNNALGKATLGFCGFTITRIMTFGSVRHSTPQSRGLWLMKVHKQALKLKHGTLPPGKKIKIQLINWLKAIRLQFYPMTFIAYTAGAYGAVENGLDKKAFWLGYAWLFLLEVATVFSNEVYDYDTDENNELFGPFNGGSRVIVNKEISRRNMKRAVWLTGSLSVIALMLLLIYFPSDVLATALFCLAVSVLALGYTVPPLKLSYRGFGELTVGITHSVAVIAAGYLFQGGAISNGFPWLLSLPLFFSILPSIILAGIPDHLADKQAGKGTLAVRMGPRAAIKLAMILTLAALLAVLVVQMAGQLPGAFNGILYGIVPHAFLLIYLLARYLGKYERTERIDGLIIAALTYLMWFAVVPMINLI